MEYNKQNDAENDVFDMPEGTPSFPALLTVSPSPHQKTSTHVPRMMVDVLIALLPAYIFGVVWFGLNALVLGVVSVAACMLSELVFEKLLRRPVTVMDGSAAVTGLLLAMNVPVTVPIPYLVIADVFAIVIVKCLFGGLGCNPVNPAITGRVFMLIAFGSMTVQAMPTVVDAVSSATPLAAETSIGLKELLLGLHGGAIGETCAIALLLGGIYLLARRVITWHVPVAFIGSVYICSFFMEGMDPIRALELVLSGGLLIGAIFMATDYVTSPSTSWGKIIFGVGAGLVTFLIRYFGTYPEGVSFAILFMNILTPYIDSWTKHRVLGTGGIKA